ncbi:aryl hydrocarbon receptor-like [Salvelinus fontinalis]|uniref:aryl hydrocarbon receptor-like n=1 Tax=Salvelinus fontinalis TaxID=8038 RepID=UPI0024865FA2|nr:aryl hydrocarbon receptor-like [Salvelinus fontinalis]
MLGSTAQYAAKKRKKPVQKIPKPPPTDGIKSNPSKRHRDRLNGELDKLTGLLPFSEDVRARLDKLSVLRLSVGYLKVKSFFSATMKKGGPGWGVEKAVVFGGNGQITLAKSTTTTISGDAVTFSEGNLLLQALNGFVLVVTAEGYVFYSSPTVQDYLGFHQSDVVHQSVFELIHTDDRALFRRQLHFALNPNQFDTEPGTTKSLQPNNSSDITSNIVSYNPQHIPPENSSFLERNFVCRFRCLLDNSSGFLALNFNGRLKYLHGQNKMSDDGTLDHPQLALFVVATPIQTPSILEIRTKTLIFQTKHKLDFTPINVDTRGKVVLGYTELELCMRGSGYQFIHAADMMYCADNHVRMIKTGESGLTVFRLLAKNGVWIWVQANARLIYKGGRPDFIMVRQRPLSNKEGEEQLRQRRLQLPFNFATGEAVLYEVGPSLDVADVPTQSKGPKIRKMAEEMALDPDSMLGSMLRQDQSVYMQTSPSEPSSDPPNPQELSSWEDQAFSNSHAMANVPGDSWQSQHHTMPKPDAGIREESTVQDLMETLQQIIGDNSLCSSLDVDPTELKDWENTLLKMSSSNCEMSEDLDDILNHDILSYVEEHLFKENGGLKMPEHLGSMLGSVSVNNPVLEVPECLTNVDLQGNTMMPGGKGFNWGVDPQQNQLLGMGGLSAAETVSNVRGMMKLTHMGSQMGLNGHTLQQASSRNTFAQSLGKNLGLESNANPLAFNPSLTGSCAQVRQNQAKGRQQGLQASPILSSPGNGLASYSLRQQMQSGIANRSSATQVIPAAMGLPIQSQLLGWNTNDQLMRFQDQSSISQSDPFAVPGQETMWMPLPSSMPNTNMVADTLLETFSQNISNQPKDIILDPNPASCLQGHFSLQTQQQQQQKMLPTMLHQQNGHQHNVMGSFYNNQVSDFQIAPQLPIPGLEAHPQQNSQAQNYNSDQTISGQYRPQKTSAAVTPPFVSSNSCMFSSTNSPSVPVNRVCLNPNTALGSLVPSSCQRATAPLHDHSPSQASCYFQRNSSGPIVGSSAIPQGDTNISPLSCQVGPGLTPGGLTPDSLLVQQQYLNCNGQTQVTNCPMEENMSFQFPPLPLPNGTTYFSENNQTNCCDF